MLILGRKAGQRIIIGDGEIVITVTAIEQGYVRIGVDAPRDIEVHRDEVYDRIVAERQLLAEAG